MRVVDTSLWVEYLANGALADQAEKCIAPLASCIVPAMVHYELIKWSRRNSNDEQAKLLQATLTECQTADMDLMTATEAALLSVQYKLHATDAIIYATARLHYSPLFTCDSHFKELPGVEYFEKSA